MSLINDNSAAGNLYPVPGRISGNRQQAHLINRVNYTTVKKSLFHQNLIYIEESVPFRYKADSDSQESTPNSKVFKADSKEFNSYSSESSPYSSESSSYSLESSSDSSEYDSDSSESNPDSLESSFNSSEYNPHSLDFGAYNQNRR